MQNQMFKYSRIHNHCIQSTETLSQHKLCWKRSKYFVCLNSNYQIEFSNAQHRTVFIYFPVFSVMHGVAMCHSRSIRCPVVDGKLEPVPFPFKMPFQLASIARAELQITVARLNISGVDGYRRLASTVAI